MIFGYFIETCFEVVRQSRLSPGVTAEIIPHLTDGTLLPGIRTADESIQLRLNHNW